MFALEIILADFGVATFGPIVLSSVTATTGPSRRGRLFGHAARAPTPSSCQDARPMKLIRLPTRGRAAAVLLASLVTACTRPFDVPPAPTGPSLTGFTPDHGYAGDTLLLEGSNFDAVAENNEILFPYGSARGASFDAQGRLVAYVPQGPDTGVTVGPLVVATPQGRSAAVGTFNYWGIGHPNHGTALDDVRVLHRPEGIVAVHGDVLVPSAYFRMLASRSGLRVGLASKPHGIASSRDGTTVFVAFADDGVWAVDPRTGAVGAKTALPGVFVHQLVAGEDARGALVHAVGTDRDGAAVLVTLHGATLAADPTRALPVRAVRGAALAQDGTRLYLVAERDGVDGLERGLLSVDTTDAGSTPGWAQPPADQQPAGPVALVETPQATRVAVVLEDSRLALWDAATRKWDATTVTTGSDTRVTALLAVPLAQGPTLVATKPDDEMIVSVDPLSGKLRWTSWLATRPRALALDASTGHVFAADDVSNGIDEVVGEDGTYIGRVSLDTGLGNAPGTRFGPAADFDGGDSDQTHRMLFLARNFRRVVPINDSTLELDTPLALDDSTGPALGLVGAPDGTVFAVHEHEVGRFAGIAQKQRNKKELVIIRDLPEALTRVVVLPDGALVLGSAHHADLYRPDADGKWSRAGSGVTHAEGHLEELVARPDGTVLALWQKTESGPPLLDGGVWTAADLAAGLAPRGRYAQASDVHGFFGLVDVEAGPTLLFNWCDAYRPDAASPVSPGRCSLLLGAGLGAGGPRLSVVKEVGPLAVTPDRRYFLWTRFGLGDHIVRLAVADTSTTGDGSGPMADYSSWRVAADFAWPAFDPSGEWLYVPVPSLDQISVFH